MSTLTIRPDSTGDWRTPALDAQWYAAYTCVNQERMVAERLRDRGIEHFLPTYTTVRRRCDRRVVINVPLLPGYVFIRIPLSMRVRVLEVPRIVRIVGHGSTGTAIPTQQIESLRTGLIEGHSAAPCEYLVKGAPVRVIRGPFAGLEGKLVRRKSSFRLVLSIDLIRQSFMVEVGEEDLERIH